MSLPTTSGLTKPGEIRKLQLKCDSLLTFTARIERYDMVTRRDVDGIPFRISCTDYDYGLADITVVPAPEPARQRP
jgi:hypothetical protein